MKIVERRIFRGPNLYAHFPVMRLILDLGELELWPTAKIPGFVDALLQALPGLSQHGCSYGEHGGFVRRLGEDEGTWMGHVLEHVAIELQQLTSAKVTFGKTRSADEPRHYTVVYEFEEERVGEAAGDLALRLLHHLLPEHLRPEVAPDVAPEVAFDFKAEVDALIAFAQTRQLGPSTASLVRAAEERDIPWLRLNDESLVQFGHGKYQKRIQATVTSETRHIAVAIASDKEETNKILAGVGLPVPRQRLVRTAEDAAIAAARLQEVHRLDAILHGVVGQHIQDELGGIVPRLAARTIVEAQRKAQRRLRGRQRHLGRIGQGTARQPATPKQPEPGRSRVPCQSQGLRISTPL